MRILVGSGISGSSAGEIPHGTCTAIGNIFSRATWSSCKQLRQPPAAGQHRHRVGAADRRDRHDRHAAADRQLDEALAPGEHRLVALGPRPQRVALAAGPQRHVVTGGQRGGDAVRGGRQDAHPPEVAPDTGQRHQRVVRGAVQRARSSPKRRHHCTPIVQASHTNGAPEWMPISSAGRLGDLLPALDLHPEPVVHQRVPQVLLALHELPVGTVERPLAGAVGDPSGDAGLLLAPLGDLAPGRLRVALGLAFSRPSVHLIRTMIGPGSRPALPCRFT